MSQDTAPLPEKDIQGSSECGPLFTGNCIPHSLAGLHIPRPIHSVSQTHHNFSRLLASVYPVPSVWKALLTPTPQLAKNILIFEIDLNQVRRLYTSTSAPAMIFFSKAQALSLSPRAPQGLTDTQ